MIRALYRLSKPGIVYGNVFTTLAGYLFASQMHVQWAVLASVLFGMAGVIAGACAFNNILDRDIDAKMERTKHRPTITGELSLIQSSVFGAAVTGAGIALLWWGTNPATVFVALGGFLVYVVAYGYAKRVTRFHTLIGSIAGSAPILAGYVAYAGSVDAAGAILYLAMLAWQMPHFYAIALYRQRDYEAAGIPLLPSEKGARATKRAIIAYIAAFFACAEALYVIGAAGIAYAAVVGLFAGYWLLRALQGSGEDAAAWGRRVFFASLNALLAFSAALSFGSFLP